jgi:hypothetical protein
MRTGSSLLLPHSPTPFLRPEPLRRHSVWSVQVPAAVLGLDYMSPLSIMLSLIHSLVITDFHHDPAAPLQTQVAHPTVAQWCSDRASSRVLAS